MFYSKTLSLDPLSLSLSFSWILSPANSEWENKRGARHVSRHNHRPLFGGWLNFQQLAWQNFPTRARKNKTKERERERERKVRKYRETGENRRIHYRGFELIFKPPQTTEFSRVRPRWRTSRHISFTVVSRCCLLWTAELVHKGYHAFIKYYIQTYLR